MKPPLTAERLRQALTYEPQTGKFRWASQVKKTTIVGALVGYMTKSGTLVIYLDGRSYLAHRLAWLWMTGSWPVNVIDHRDTNSSNNRWSNLRDVTNSVNQQNKRRARKDNRTGVIGVQPIGPKFQARIQLNGVSTYLGLHPTVEEAHEAYLKAKREIHEGNTL